MTDQEKALLEKFSLIADDIARELTDDGLNGLLLSIIQRLACADQPEEGKKQSG